MAFFKVMVRSLLVAQLSFGYHVAWSAPKRDALPFVIASFDLIVHQSAMVRNVKDFERFLLYRMKAEDRKAVVAKLAKQKEFPTFKRQGKTLVLDTGVAKYTLLWPDATKNELVINDVAWTYDPAKPFLSQYEILESAVAAKRKSAFVQAVLPEAEAAFFVPFLLMLAGAAVGVIGADMATEGWCYIVGTTETTTQKCIDVRRAKEGALIGDAPALDAVSNQAGSDNTNVLGRFEAQDWRCPTNDDGKPREYSGLIRTVETKEGQTTPTSSWFKVSAKFSPEGFPTDLIITRQGPGTDSESLVIHIVFDPTTKKPLSYRVPNPSYDPDNLLSKATITLMQNQKLSPEQADAIERAKDIIRFINYRNYNCVSAKAEESKAQGIAPVAPGASAQ